ncbi:MAG TPA: hypothetical protein VJL29_04665, partial [Thermoguttaceae bacterium]|nr:hypothetical protein [Thermoguttaceae bacterium]
MRLVSSEHRSRLWGSPAGWLAGLVVLFFLSTTFSLTGCGGCRNDPKTEAEKEAERLAKEREERRPDFEIV